MMERRSLSEAVEEFEINERDTPPPIPVEGGNSKKDALKKKKQDVGFKLDKISGMIQKLSDSIQDGGSEDKVDKVRAKMKDLRSKAQALVAQEDKLSDAIKKA